MNAEHIGSAAPSNTNSGEVSTVVRSDKSIRYTNLPAFGRTEIGLNALVIPGDCVALYGVNRNHVNGPQIVDRTFSVGDSATCGGRNVDFIGTIVSIGEKTVTVHSDVLGNRRFTIGDFARLNQSFDLVKVEARNAAWMD
jgi:hypothetical protein